MPLYILWRLRRGKKNLFHIFQTHLRSENLLTNTLAEYYHLKLLLKVLRNFYCKEKAIPLQQQLNNFGAVPRRTCSDPLIFFLMEMCAERNFLTSNPTSSLGSEMSPWIHLSTLQLAEFFFYPKG